MTADPFKNIPNADDSLNGEFSPAKPVSTEDAERAGYIAGLRELADILETMPGIPLPYHGSASHLTIMFFAAGEDNRARLAAAAKAIGGQWAKDGDDVYFDMTTRLRGLQLQMSAFREQVCRKVVTGRREVTELVPDPSAPKIKVTKTVEDVTWECSPLLAEHTAAAPFIVGDHVRNRYTGATGIVTKVSPDFVTVQGDEGAPSFSGWHSAFEPFHPIPGLAEHTQAAQQKIIEASR